MQIHAGWLIPDCATKTKNCTHYLGKQIPDSRWQAWPGRAGCPKPQSWLFVTSILLFRTSAGVWGSHVPPDRLGRSVRTAEQQVPRGEQQLRARWHSGERNRFRMTGPKGNPTHLLKAITKYQVLGIKSNTLSLPSSSRQSKELQQVYCWITVYTHRRQQLEWMKGPHTPQLQLASLLAFWKWHTSKEVD